MAPENQQPPNCPSCESADIRRSRDRSIDWLCSFGNYKAYRCRKCRHRFRMITPPTPPYPKVEGRKKSSQRRKALKRSELLVYAAALIVFAIAVFFITIERG